MHLAIITILVLAAVVVFRTAAVKNRVLMAAKQRTGLSEKEFVRKLVSKGIPDEIGRAVFAGFYEWSKSISDDFPITPDLPLRDFVPWVEHDEEDVIDEILIKTGRCYPSRQMLPVLPAWTLEDVAKFIAGCQRVVKNDV